MVYFPVSESANPFSLSWTCIVSADYTSAKKKKKGSKVYSDDWGYGVVINRQLNGENFVIEVQFETGYKKKFLPEFNSNSITLIKD